MKKSFLIIGILMGSFNEVMQAKPCTRYQRNKAIDAVGFINVRQVLKNNMASATLYERKMYKKFIDSLGVPKDFDYRKQRTFLMAIADSMREKNQSKIEILRVAPAAWKVYQNKN